MSTTVGQRRSGVAGQDGGLARAEDAGPLPAPRAARLRRPGWRDPRLLLGTALVGVSVLLGSWAVTTAGRTVPVLAAGAALVPGDQIRPEDVRVQEVRLPEGGAEYLLAGADLEGLVVTRVVREGELVPASAVATAPDLGARAVAVTTGAPVSAAVVEGSLVDVWFVPEQSDRADDDGGPLPRQLAAALVVAEVETGSSAFSVTAGTTVHVLVPTTDLPTVLAAVRGPGVVDLVPVPGGTS
ncbi:hypothetical protein N866_13755 [Actinotalea ferrariae CF5-4]|uniref:SAF domain-containing protein n=1 Tax=Actinotalea ferrariae CF5-4 TaxID=948458 RepID=A0A021VLA3_9CELL|nr:SAF domain-containing protein [Actinotalea ferrariae]EYR61956.1 hypothetical protein N866_13755 [Actinotalea ferrariae CF5-4]